VRLFIQTLNSLYVINDTGIVTRNGEFFGLVTKGTAVDFQPLMYNGNPEKVATFTLDGVGPVRTSIVRSFHAVLAR
jgi:hypothetical protein